jgi:hypothetical protein
MSNTCYYCDKDANTKVPGPYAYDICVRRDNDLKKVGEGIESEARWVCDDHYQTAKKSRYIIKERVL